jgi:hypothetical protein
VERTEHRLSGIEWSIRSTLFVVFDALGDTSIDDSLGSKGDLPSVDLCLEKVSDSKPNLLAKRNRQGDLIFGFDLHERHLTAPSRVGELKS